MQLNEKLYFNEDILTLEGELYVESVLVRDSKVFGEKKTIMLMERKLTQK